MTAIVSKRMKSLQGDLRFNETQVKWILRDLTSINDRIARIKAAIAELELFSEFDV